MQDSIIRLFKTASFFFFLVSFVFSFFIPQLYKEIVFFQFMVIAPLVVIINYNFGSLSQTLQILFLSFTIVSIALGVPGSALGYAISASIGLFVSQKFHTNKDRDFKIEFWFFFSTTLIYLLASLYLMYTNLRNAFSLEQIAGYFGQASINYASLTLASFCSIFSTWCSIVQFTGCNITEKQIKLLRIISGLLAGCILGLAIVFSTRSAMFGFIPPFLYAIQPKRPYLYLVALMLMAVIVYVLFPVFAEFVLLLIVPGRESLFDLYDSELKGQERSGAILAIFEKAIPKMSLCINCSDYLSYSGISNLLALSFPFSIYYLIKILVFIFVFIKTYIMSLKTSKLLILILGMSFLNSLILAVFQADFLSTASLFFVVGSGLVLFNSKQVVFKKIILKTNN